VPTGKRFVLQQYRGTSQVHLSQLLGGQHVFQHDFSFAYSVSPGFVGVPLGLVFEPGSKVMVWNDYNATQAVTFDMVGYLQDV
jgi:hypothetical protein